MGARINSLLELGGRLLRDGLAVRRVHGLMVVEVVSGRRRRSELACGVLGASEARLGEWGCHGCGVIRFGVLHVTMLR